ncbi:hypothetical protein MVEN_02231300 [Mycena venus]|uniref:F-box domain-containing protein n=1 Tax=Mycena venus TaxID=2733690 RepID=A0A8H7CGR7_9AGAR|nr:hypothetical protein MVEN_02231300 [Mycena venus]
MVRPIVATDWDRPLVYTHRVKNLAMDYYFSDANLEILQALSLCCPGGVIFPNLRTLNWPWPFFRFIPFRVFFPSTLQRIGLSCTRSNTTMSLLSTLAISCPALRHFDISFHDSGTQDGNDAPTISMCDNATSLFVCALQHIESLGMGVPTVAALQHISQLPQLTSLELKGLPTSLAASERLPPFTSPYLHTLTLGPSEIDAATKFLRSFSEISLTYFSFILKTCVSVAKIDAFFEAFRTACCETSLESFTLGNHANIFPPPESQKDYMITSRSLRILSCFGNIKRLSILSPVGFDVDDATVAQLAVAWPRMESIVLQTDLMDLPSSMTLRALHSLAVHCPQLRSVGMEINACPVPSHLGPRVSQDTLSYIDVGGSSIVHAPSVARYLSSFFPNLTTIYTQRDGMDNEHPDEVEQHRDAIAHHLLWKQVEDQIPEFVVARREEHN